MSTSEMALQYWTVAGRSLCPWSYKNRAADASREMSTLGLGLAWSYIQRTVPLQSSSHLGQMTNVIAVTSPVHH